MTENPSKSILVSTYNWPKALELAIRSIFKQTVLPDEILIADDGSSNETKLIIDKLKLESPIPIIHIWHEDDGFRKTLILNKTIAKCKSKYLLQIDGDIILDNRFIEDHLQIAEKGYFISGKRAYITKSETEKHLQDPDKKINFWKLKDKMQVVRLPHFFNFRRLTDSYNPNKGIKGSNTSYWMEDIIKINGFNEDLQMWGYEDKEIAARLINNGIRKKRVRYRCISYHLHHKIASKDNLPKHTSVLEHIISEKIKRCNNGLSNH
ncbi:glycosyltransferase family 2 protein [Labilibaculum manganireducens]|uniref:glycosyltransferase family 2 protein n=1 Tax=Labilibaculum manganireducens TaxID=1940525 RepID=UPI0029F538A9|nr:glycosyltransferase family 2 protein [Labilibaculum manganireducens]